MKKLISTLILSSLLIAFSISNAFAELEKEPFTPERFEELQAAGAVVLIDVYADWCPTCARQQKALEQFREKHPDEAFHILVVDFDKDKEWVRHFRAPRQSTLLIFQGHEQYWFSVAETDPKVIEKELKRALAAAE